jgi:hypothetical protein
LARGRLSSEQSDVDLLLSSREQPVFIPLGTFAGFPSCGAQVAKLGFASTRHMIAAVKEFYHLTTGRAASPILTLGQLKDVAVDFVGVAGMRYIAFNFLFAFSTRAGGATGSGAGDCAPEPI